MVSFPWNGEFQKDFSQVLRIFPTEIDSFHTSCPLSYGLSFRTVPLCVHSPPIWYLFMGKNWEKTLNVEHSKMPSVFRCHTHERLASKS
jgi:hypothetical protein